MPENFEIKKHLEFKGKFRDKILSGEKKTTLRAYTNLRKGDLVYIHCGGKVIGVAEIKNVSKKDLDEISDEDARFDGFKNKDELFKELKECYVNLPKKIYVIEFELKEKINENPYYIYYKNYNLIDIAKKALEYLELSEEEKRILELFLKLKSIRKVAFKLGGLKKRRLVRKVLRDSYRKLRKMGLI